MANNVDGKLAIIDVVAGLGRAASALLAAMVQKSLEESRGLLSSTSSAVLEVGAQGSRTGNLLASVVVAITRLNAVHDGLEVDELRKLATVVA